MGSLRKHRKGIESLSYQDSQETFINFIHNVKYNISVNPKLDKLVSFYAKY